LTDCHGIAGHPLSIGGTPACDKNAHLRTIQAIMVMSERGHSHSLPADGRKLNEDPQF